MRIYGYCRVSKPKQKIERQVENILALYPDAKIIREIHTRTAFDGRKEWAKLMQCVRPGDLIVFDSVSRMSGNEAEGFAAYQQLYNMGVDLAFLKEPHINTETYKTALSRQIEMTGTKVDLLLTGINEFLLAIAEEQISLAFLQAEKEVSDIHQRTREGLREAKRQGKQLGRPGGKTYITEKEKATRAIIAKHAKEFGGSLSDSEVMKLAGVSHNSYYKYKRKLVSEDIEKKNGFI